MPSFRSRATRPATGLAVLVAGAALVAGCARPGQLGYEGAAAPEPQAPVAAAPTGPAAPPGPAAPDDPSASALPGIPVPPVTAAGSDVQATLDRPVDISTPGPAELLVRTEVLQPGQGSGWVRHPGTVVSAVRSGTVTVQRAGGCEPENFGPGQAFFLGDGEPNLLRNDGAAPVVLTRSELLAPGAPEREPVEPAC